MTAPPTLLSDHHSSPPPTLSRGTGVPEEYAARGLRVELINDLAELAHHADAWDELALTAPQRLPMLSHAWIASWLEHEVLPHKRWWCALAYEGERLVGVLPVVVSPHRMFGLRWPLLRTSRSNSRAGDVLMVSGRESAILPALLAALERAVPGCLGVELWGVRDNSPTLAAIARGLPGRVVVRTLHSAGSYIDTTVSHDEFFKSLGASHRKHLRSATNRLDKLPAVVTQTLADEATAEMHLQRFLALEAAGWKGQHGTAIASSPIQTAFYRALVRRLAVRGWLEWHFLEAAGRPIAGDLVIRFGRALVFPKGAYDEEFAKYSPSHVLFARGVDRAFMSGDIVEMNQLTSFAWMHPWRMRQSQYYNLWLYPCRPIPMLLGYLPRQAELLLRRVLRSLLAHVGGRHVESRSEARRAPSALRRLTRR